MPAPCSCSSSESTGLPSETYCTAIFMRCRNKTVHSFSIFHVCKILLDRQGIRSTGCLCLGHFETAIVVVLSLLNPMVWSPHHKRPEPWILNQIPPDSRGHILSLTTIQKLGFFFFPSEPLPCFYSESESESSYLVVVDDCTESVLIYSFSAVHTTFLTDAQSDVE